MKITNEMNSPPLAFSFFIFAHLSLKIKEIFDEISN